MDVSSSSWTRKEKQKDIYFQADLHFPMQRFLAHPILEALMHAVMKGHFTTSHILNGNSRKNLFLVKTTTNYTTYCC